VQVQEPTDLLLLDEISQISRVPRETLRWYRKKKDRGPKTFRLGGRIVAYRSDVDAWILAQKRKEHDVASTNQLDARPDCVGDA
jgi:predicted DNA-binding transcriptional regulator AlpA